MYGVCESVTTSGGVCDTVYYYLKEGAKICNDPKYPHLGIDDLCYTTPQ